VTTDKRSGKIEEALERARAEPVLGDFAVPLPKLARAGSTGIGASFEELAKVIGVSKETTTVTFRVTEPRKVHVWSLSSGPSGSRVTTGDPQPPDLEVLLDAETWKQIAAGALSPLEAFGRGKMRIRGDLNLARRIVRRIHRSTK
jgi:hypothetical protein